MGFVNIRGVFENPEELAKYDCDGSDCYDEFADYPIPMDMLQAINSGISKSVVEEIMSNAKFLPKVIEYDRFQPEFYEDTFTYIKKRCRASHFKNR